jgi:hypothetical protein
LKNDFSKLFPQKSPFSPTFFGGKFSAEFSSKFSPEKMYEKLAPGYTYSAEVCIELKSTDTIHNKMVY